MLKLLPANNRGVCKYAACILFNLLLLNMCLKAQFVIPKFYPFTFELTDVEPGFQNKANNSWLQLWPMPPCKSEVTIQYTLKNKVNTLPGRIEATIGNFTLLSSGQFPNRVPEIAAGQNLTSQFHTTGLPPGNYTLRLRYITQGKNRIFTKDGKWKYADSTLADATFDYIVNSGIDAVLQSPTMLFIPASVITEQLKNALGGGQVQISQTSSGQPLAFTLPDGTVKQSMSYIQFGFLLQAVGIANIDLKMTEEKSFSMDQMVGKNSGGGTMYLQFIITQNLLYVEKLRFFVNNIHANLDNDLEVSLAKDDIILSITLHAPDPCIKGEGFGYYPIFGLIPVPLNWQDGLCPDLALDRGKVTLHLSPFVTDEGVLKLNPPSSMVEADLSISPGILNQYIKDAKNKMISNFQGTINNELGKDKVKKGLEKGLFSVLLQLAKRKNENITCMTVNERGITISFKSL